MNAWGAGKGAGLGASPVTNMHPTGRATSRNRGPRPLPWGEGGTEAWGNKTDRQAAAPSSHPLLRQEGPQHLTGGGVGTQNYTSKASNLSQSPAPTPVERMGPSREHTAHQTPGEPLAPGPMSTQLSPGSAVTWVIFHLDRQREDSKPQLLSTERSLRTHPDPGQPHSQVTGDPRNQ